ncbi:hypothetical protein FACS1894187_03080 [Synergistales bacterium]|nr:hypothetical protein FACS1894187_03080 [Synergistales bacterium]
MANALPIFENVRNLLTKAHDLTQTRELLTDFLKMPENRLFPVFGVRQWVPSEVHSLKDLIFQGLVTELARNGWNCNAASFGESRRDTFLMVMAECGYAKTVTRLLDIGAEADFNSQGTGASTPLMRARDPEIIKKIMYFGANPLAVNSMNQTDFTYKLLRGMVPGARYYLSNTERIPFQSLLNNFQDCMMDGPDVPYTPMYPLSLVPIVPEGVPYDNILDKPLIECMMRKHCMPFTSTALTYRLPDTIITVWQHIKSVMKMSAVASPHLVFAYMACMTKMEECRKPDDFTFLEAYIEKPLPRDFNPRGKLSKDIFAYMLFTLLKLQSAQILRWVAMLGNITRKVTAWMGSLGDETFRVSGALSDKQSSNALQELLSIQALLVMRIRVTDNFGEFKISGADLGSFSADISDESIAEARSSILENLERAEKMGKF